MGRSRRAVGRVQGVRCDAPRVTLDEGRGRNRPRSASPKHTEAPAPPRGLPHPKATLAPRGSRPSNPGAGGGGPGHRATRPRPRPHRAARAGRAHGEGAAWCGREHRHGRRWAGAARAGPVAAGDPPAELAVREPRPSRLATPGDRAPRTGAHRHRGQQPPDRRESQRPADRQGRHRRGARHRRRVHRHARGRPSPSRSPGPGLDDPGRRHPCAGHARRRPRRADRARAGARARPPAARLPAVRERTALRLGPDHRRAPAPRGRPVAALLLGGRHQSLRLVAGSPQRGRDQDDVTLEPDGLVPLPQAHERQRPGRPGSRAHLVFARRGARCRCPGGPLGLSRLRDGRPRPLVPLRPSGPAIVPRHRRRRPAGAVLGRDGPRRRRACRPVLVLSLCRADRGAASSACPSTTPVDPSR